jgi:CheY-like chemotaxis protein
MTEIIQIVDDDAGIRELLKFKLVQQGFEVRTSTNGRDCIDSLHTGPLPDVLLLDVRMPRMDGLDALERIRAEFETPLPVVLLTGAEPESDMAAERVAKPFTIEEVLTAIERALER